MRQAQRSRFWEISIVRNEIRFTKDEARSVRNTSDAMVHRPFILRVEER